MSEFEGVCAVCGETVTYGEYTWLRAVENTAEDHERDQWDMLIHTKECLSLVEKAIDSVTPFQEA